MFEDILNSCGSIDFVKPVFCSQHVKESLTHFCKMCMVRMIVFHLMFCVDLWTINFIFC